jgi:hypothetical protein
MTIADVHEKCKSLAGKVPRDYSLLPDFSSLLRPVSGLATVRSRWERYTQTDHRRYVFRTALNIKKLAFLK